MMDEGARPLANLLMESSITPTPPGTWLAAPRACPTAVAVRKPGVSIAGGRNTLSASPANNQSSVDTTRAIRRIFREGRKGMAFPRNPVPEITASVAQETTSNTPTERPTEADNHGRSKGAQHNNMPAKNAWPSHPAINRNPVSLAISAPSMPYWP